MRDVLRVIAQCHSKQLLHRDIKPGNFLLASEKEGAPLKAIDLGLAAPFVPGKPREDLGLDGTPYYMAPEVLRSDTWPKSDVWQAGVMAYQLLTGKLPFSDRDPGGGRGSVAALFKAILNDDLEAKLSGGHMAGVSPAARDFVRSLLARDVDERPTALEALKHPFLSEARPAEAPPGGHPLGHGVVARLQEFCQAPAFKRSVLLRVARELMGVPDDGGPAGSAPGGPDRASPPEPVRAPGGPSPPQAHRLGESPGGRSHPRAATSTDSDGQLMPAGRMSLDMARGRPGGSFRGADAAGDLLLSPLKAPPGAVGQGGGYNPGSPGSSRVARSLEAEGSPLARASGGAGQAPGFLPGAGAPGRPSQGSPEGDCEGGGPLADGGGRPRASEGGGGSPAPRGPPGPGGARGAVALLQGIRELFQLMDVDADGRVSLRDLRQGLRRQRYLLSKEEAAHMLGAMDVDDEGNVSLAAFVAAVVDWRSLQGTAEWMAATRSVFASLDSEGRGDLTMGDILSTLQASLPPDEVRSAVAEALMDAGVIDTVEYYARPTVDESLRAGNLFPAALDAGGASPDGSPAKSPAPPAGGPGPGRGAVPGLGRFKSERMDFEQFVQMMRFEGAAEGSAHGGLMYPTRQRGLSVGPSDGGSTGSRSNVGSRHGALEFREFVNQSLGKTYGSLIPGGSIGGSLHRARGGAGGSVKEGTAFAALLRAGGSRKELSFHGPGSLGPSGSMASLQMLLRGSDAEPAEEPALPPPGAPLGAVAEGEEEGPPAPFAEGGSGRGGLSHAPSGEGGSARGGLSHALGAEEAARGAGVTLSAVAAKVERETGNRLQRRSGQVRVAGGAPRALDGEAEAHGGNLYKDLVGGRPGQ